LALAHVIKDFAFEVSDSTSVPLQLDESTLFLQNKGGLMLKVVKAD
jgi:hypothetical protein